MFTKKFWQDTAERTIATFAAALAGSLTITSISDWKKLLLSGGVAAGVTLLKCIVASQAGDPTSASLVK